MQQATRVISCVCKCCVFALRGRKVKSLQIVWDWLVCVCLILACEIVRRVDCRVLIVLSERFCVR